MSCCGRKKRVESLEIIDTHPQKEFYEEYLVDIPVLFYEPHTLKTCNENPDCTIISYSTTTLLPQAYEFYAQEMERLGWQEIGIYMDHEKKEEANCGTFLYENPHKYCVVTLYKARHKQLPPYQLRVKVVSGMKKEW